MKLNFDFDQLVFQSQFLFLKYAQHIVQIPLNTQQDLVVWHSQMLKEFELFSTLQDFFCHFEDDLHLFPVLEDFLKILKTEGDHAIFEAETNESSKLLAQLKQGISIALSEEIQRILKVQQALNNQKLRQKNEEKIQSEEDYQTLMQEMKINAKDNSLAAQNAAVCWHYMLNHLEACFQDYEIIKKFSKNKDDISEEIWVKNFIDALDQKNSVYAKLPDAVKKGLKVYLTSYLKNTDYAKYLALQNSFVKFEVKRLNLDNRSILRIKGGYFALSDILASSELSASKLNGIDQIEILATGTIFVDTSMDDARFSSVNIVLGGKTIDFKPNANTLPIVFNTSGKDGISYDDQAPDGKHGMNGQSGFSGQGGKSAGYIEIRANTILNAKNATFKMNGGRGGHGQGGGKGDKGQAGVKGESGYDRATFSSIRGTYYPNNADEEYECNNGAAYYIKKGSRGTLGQPGGNGGNAGAGGAGGYPGNLVIFDYTQQIDLNDIVEKTAHPGKDGDSGSPGPGGEAGPNGPNGPQFGKAIVWRSFQDPIRVFGEDLEAEWEEKDGLFTKNGWKFKGAMTETEIAHMQQIRTRTQHAGYVGANAYHKQSATKNRKIQFDSILTQCPEIAAHILGDVNQTKQAQQAHLFNQLFALGDTRHHLENDIQVLENNGESLNKRYEAIEENQRTIFNESINQRISHEQQVTQLVDVHKNVLEEKNDSREQSTFFTETSEMIHPLIKKAKEMDLSIVARNQLQTMINWLTHFESENLDSALRLNYKAILNHLIDKKIESYFIPLLANLREQMSVSHQTDAFLQVSHRNLLDELKLFSSLIQKHIQNSESKEENNFLQVHIAFEKNIQALYQRLEKEINKLKTLHVDIDYVQTYVAMNAVLKMIPSNPGMDSEKIPTVLCEIGLFYLLEPLLVEKSIQKNEIDSVQWVAQLIHSPEKCLKILSFLTLNAVELDILNHQNRDVDIYLHQYYIKKHFSHKESIILEKQKQLDPQVSQNISIYLENIFHYLGNRGCQFNYAERIELLDKLAKEIEALKDKPAILQEYIQETFFTCRKNFKKTEQTVEEKLEEEEELPPQTSKLFDLVLEKLNTFIQRKTSSSHYYKTFSEKLEIFRYNDIVLNILLEKLTIEIKLFNQDLTISLSELGKMISEFVSLEEHLSILFLKELAETPFFAWLSVFRRQKLNLILPKTQDENRQRALLLLMRLEEKIGADLIDRLTKRVEALSIIDYAMLADILVLANYEQLTLDKVSIQQLENISFDEWKSTLEKYHQTMISRPRDLTELIRIMQTDARNKNIACLQGTPSLVEQQINKIDEHRFQNNHSLTNTLFSATEKKEEKAEENVSFDFKNKPINQWDKKNILTWVKKFEKEKDREDLVKQHLPEVLAIIAQAIYLNKGFYPKLTQYLAVITALYGTEHGKKIISEIATGQGKTITGAMFGLLQLMMGNLFRFYSSSSDLAFKGAEECRGLFQTFDWSVGYSGEIDHGPFYLFFAKNEISDEQQEMLYREQGIAFIKKEDQYLLRVYQKESYQEESLDVSRWPALQEKLKKLLFTNRACLVSENFHEEIVRILRDKNLNVPKAKSEIEKTREAYRAHALFTDMQNAMRCELLTQFLGYDITQNRHDVPVIDEFDQSIVDEARNILYISHHILDMRHLNGLFVAIWEGIHDKNFQEPTESNVKILSEYFSKQIVFGRLSIADALEGKIQVPLHLKSFVEKTLSVWILSAYIAKSLSRNKEYHVTAMNGGERKSHPVNDLNGETAKNKVYANGVQKFVEFDNQNAFDDETLKAVFESNITHILNNYKSLFGFTGTLPSLHEMALFQKQLDISTQCIIPRNELLNLKVDPPKVVETVEEQWQTIANIVEEKSKKQPILINCKTIDDVNKLADYLQEKVKDIKIHKRALSFEAFTKGDKEDPLCVGDVLIGNQIIGRGYDPQLNDTAKIEGAYLINTAVENSRIRGQIRGRVARNGLRGSMTSVVVDVEKRPIEILEAECDFKHLQELENMRQKELAKNKVSEMLFRYFSDLCRKLNLVIKETKLGRENKDYCEKQNHALLTHWAFWLNDIEKEMEEELSTTGTLNQDDIYKKYQTFEEEMRALADKKNIFKFMTSPEDLDDLGFHLMDDNKFDEAEQCFKHVINEHNSYAGKAFYHMAMLILKKAGHGDFDARKKATYYFTRARRLFRKEVAALQDIITRLLAVDVISQTLGKGLYDNQLRKFQEDKMKVLLTHIQAIDETIGPEIEFDFFLSSVLNQEAAKKLLNDLIRFNNLKGYRVSKKIQVRTVNKKNEIFLKDGKEYPIPIPSKLEAYSEKIISCIRSYENKTLRSGRELSYDDFCVSIFEASETHLPDEKKFLAKLAFQWALEENIFKKPTFDYSRTQQFEYGDHKKKFPSAFNEELVNASAGKLRLFEEIDIKFDLFIQNFVDRHDISPHVLAYFKNICFDLVIAIEKKAIHWNWKATLLTILAVAEIAIGFALSCPILMQQGVGDLVFLATSAIRGDFSIPNWLTHKTLSLAAAGISVIANKVGMIMKEYAEKIATSEEAFFTLGENGLETTASVIHSTGKILQQLGTPLTMTESLPLGVQIKNIVKDFTIQTGVDLTLPTIMKTLSPHKIEGGVSKAIRDAIQIKTDTNDVKNICQQIFYVSESPQQAKNIITATFKEALAEYQPQPFSFGNMVFPLFSNANLNKIFEAKIGTWTESTVLREFVKFTVKHADKIGAITQCVTCATSFMATVEKLLKAKLILLQKHMPAGKSVYERTEQEVEKFNTFLAEEISSFTHEVKNMAYQNVGSKVIKPAVRCFYQSTLNGIEKGFEKMASFRQQESKKMPQKPIKKTTEEKVAKFSGQLKNEKMPTTYSVEGGETIQFSVGSGEITESFSIQQQEIIDDLLKKSFSESDLMLSSEKINEEERNINLFVTQKEVKDNTLTLEKMAIGDAYANKQPKFLGLGNKIFEPREDLGAEYNKNTISACIALQKAGISIKNMEGKTLSCELIPGEKINVLFRSRDLENFLCQKLGQPILITEKNIRDYQGCGGIFMHKYISFSQDVRFIDTIDHAFAMDVRSDEERLFWRLPSETLHNEYGHLSQDEMGQKKLMIEVLREKANQIQNAKEYYSDAFKHIVSPLDDEPITKRPREVYLKVEDDRVCYEVPDMHGELKRGEILLDSTSACIAKKFNTINTDLNQHEVNDNDNDNENASNIPVTTPSFVEEIISHHLNNTEEKLQGFINRNKKSAIQNLFSKDIENSPKVFSTDSPISFFNASTKKQIVVPVSQNDSPLELRVVAEDKNCLFTAVSMHLGIGEAELRKKVVAEMRAHPGRYQNFMTENDEAYLQAMRHLYRRPIVVVQDNRYFSDEHMPNQDQTIFIFYNGSNHYHGYMIKDGYTAKDVLNYLSQQQTHGLSMAC